jgi:hypothetical protein
MRQRPLTVAALLTAALAATPAATSSATTRVSTRATTLKATDHISGLTFTLTRRRLTLRLTDHLAGGTAAGPLLRGHLVRVVCGTHDPAKTRDLGSLARSAGVWGSSTTSALFLLNHDIERDARWCVVERLDGADIAAVDFNLGHNPNED